MDAHSLYIWGSYLCETLRGVNLDVAIVGGGRCNLTNGCSSIKELAEAYPRGGNALNRAFRLFSNKDTMQWFESRNVPLVIQEDNSVFPQSQDSQSVVDCFLEETRKLKIDIELERGIKAIQKVGPELQLVFVGKELPSRSFDKVIVATGGSSKRSDLVWLEKLNHKKVLPCSCQRRARW